MIWGVMWGDMGCDDVGDMGCGEVGCCMIWWGIICDVGCRVWWEVKWDVWRG